MNPAAGGWNNPPPPGTEAAQEVEDEYGSEDLSQNLRSIDRIDPYLKNPEYVEYEKHSQSRERDHSRHRRRSHSRERDRRSRDRDRRNRSRHHRSRSRSRRRHRHRTRSRSTSNSRSRHGKSRREKRHGRSTSRGRRHSRSYSRSRSRSRSRRRHRRPKVQYSRSTEELRSGSEEKEDPLNTSGEVEEEEEPAVKENAFKNDGSFLELFKKMQEEQQKAAEAAKEQAAASESKQPQPAFSKRRGGRILKTGMVEKQKITDETVQGEGLDAWSVYMKEVKRYKEACCDDDSKTRPLVK